MALASDFMDPGQLSLILQLGDSVEFRRGFYSHFGVVVEIQDGIGDRKEIRIVHLTRTGNAGDWTGASSESLEGDSGGQVRMDEIQEIARGSKCRKNNLLDAEHKPRDPNQIVAMANILRRGQAYYNVLYYNCESFTNYCRYGKAVSRQVQQAILIGIAVIFLVVCLGLLLKWLWHRRRMLGT